jgi:hypothetical protein
MLAGLGEAIEHLLQVIQTRAAVAADVRNLMDALPPLARIARYGDVRGTRSELVMPIIEGLFERVIIGLPGACSSLDDDAAAAMTQSINHVQESVQLLDIEQQRNEWQGLLHRLIERESIHGLVRGRCCRLLLEQNQLSEEELQHLARLALSPVTPAPQATAWVEGVLSGGGVGMLHQNDLWRALDHWLIDLQPDVFVALLPLIRRAFAAFQKPELRRMGEKIKHLYDVTGQTQVVSNTSDLQQQRADQVLPVLAQILGVNL